MSQQDIEDRLPALLRGAADAQPDAPGLFDGVVGRVRRRQRRRRGLASAAVAAVVAAAVAVPVAVSSHRTTDQRVVTVPAAPTRSAAPSRPAAPPPPASPAHCSAGNGVGVGTQKNGPKDRLLTAGAATLTVCAWTPVGEGLRSSYRLAWSGLVPAARVHAEVAALDALPLDEGFLTCLRLHPLLLSVIAGYPNGHAERVDLVEPCDAYFTNGSFDAPAPASLIRTLEDAQPVPPGPNGYLSVRLTASRVVHPRPVGRGYEGGVRVMLDGRLVTTLTGQVDDSYRGRVPAGTYSLRETTLVGQVCVGRATVTDGNETSVTVTCPAE